jgi:lysozyme family protein
VKLKEVIKTLEMLKDEYDDSKLLIVDQIRDNEIDEAEKTFKKILGLRKSIAQMESLEISL